MLAANQRIPSPTQHQSAEMSSLKMTKWHAYAPAATSPVVTAAPPPPTHSTLPALHSFPKPPAAQILPSLVPGSLLRFLLDQPARTVDISAPQVSMAIPQPLFHLTQAAAAPREEERKRLHSSGLMCLVEAAARAPGQGDQDASDSNSDSKRQKRVERSDIGSFIHVYNPMEATRRGRPRGRPFAKAAEHTRRAKVAQLKAHRIQDPVSDAAAVPTAWIRPELVRQARSESETAA